jgi:hypothetical protein
LDNVIGCAALLNLDGEGNSDIIADSQPIVKPKGDELASDFVFGIHTDHVGEVRVQVAFLRRDHTLGFGLRPLGHVHSELIVVKDTEIEITAD